MLTIMVSFDDFTIIQGGTRIELPVPEKNGYLFVEWQLGGETFSEEDTIINDITLNAVREDMYEAFETQTKNAIRLMSMTLDGI